MAGIILCLIIWLPIIGLKCIMGDSNDGGHSNSSGNKKGSYDYFKNYADKNVDEYNDFK